MIGRVMRSLARSLVLFSTVVVLAGSFAYDADASDRPVYVRGYIRSNGTYVMPHYRSAPDGNYLNNWSTKGNVNPYTGQWGKKTYPAYPTYSYRALPSYRPTYTPYRAPAYNDPYRLYALPRVPKSSLGSYGTAPDDEKDEVLGDPDDEASEDPDDDPEVR